MCGACSTHEGGEENILVSAGETWRKEKSRNPGRSCYNIYMDIKNKSAAKEWNDPAQAVVSVVMNIRVI